MPLLTAALLCICLTTRSGADVCFLALVPLAFAMATPNAPRSIYASAYLAGLSIHLVGMAWVLECYRYENAVGPYVVQWFWIGTWGGVLFVGLLASGRYILKRWPMPLTLLMPILWVTYEFIRHEMADIVTGTGFPWLKLGTAMADTRYLVQVADLGGEYLLSFVAAMIGGAIADFLGLFTNEASRKVRIKTGWALVASLLLMFAANGYGMWRVGQSTGKPGPTVGLMGELDLPPILDAERLQSGFGCEANKPRHADLLLWPELAYHHKIIEPGNRLLPIGFSRQNELGLAQRYLEKSAFELGSTLVIGCERYQVSNARRVHFNSLACTDPINGYQGCYDKVNLVPGAESSMRSAEAFHEDEFAYSRGDGYRIFDVPTENKCYRFASAICYDLCFGQHFQQRNASETNSERPDFLVQCGAEGQDSADVVATRMLRYARLRAIENRRSLVRNATFGHSALIDGNGRVLTALSTAPITTPTWLGTIPIDSRYSFYAFHGDWVAYLASMTFLTLMVIRPRHCLTQSL